MIRVKSTVEGRGGRLAQDGPKTGPDETTLRSSLHIPLRERHYDVFAIWK